MPSIVMLTYVTVAQGLALNPGSILALDRGY
ncbi:hypothetical protein DFAR_3640004 [Desulfarculales bacterium]